ncbi:MAG: hypothetical protein RBU29_16740 [bacterium]|jgi:ABC-type Zn uptake system ZnuABC Zn-binding protein ZnuA|nr:hypothetical protein [bacterium]
MKKHSSVVFLFLLTFLGIGGCSRFPSLDMTSTDWGDKSLWVSGFPAEDWCRHILPEEIRIIGLPSAGGDPFRALTVQHVRALHHVRLGIVLQTAPPSLIVPHLLGTASAVLDLTAGEDESFLLQSGPQSADPFPWLDPIWAQEAIQRIASRSQEEWPQHAEAIQRRSQDYLYEIYQRHMELSTLLQDLPTQEYHATVDWYDGWMARYGFKKKPLAEGHWSLEKEAPLEHAQKPMPIVLLVDTPLNRHIASESAGARRIVFVPDPFAAMAGKTKYLDWLEQIVERWKESGTGHEE